MVREKKIKFVGGGSWKILNVEGGVSPENVWRVVSEKKKVCGGGPGKK